MFDEIYCYTPERKRGGLVSFVCLGTCIGRKGGHRDGYWKGLRVEKYRGGEEGRVESLPCPLGM